VFKFHSDISVRYNTSEILNIYKQQAYFKSPVLNEDHLKDFRIEPKLGAEVAELMNE
jgi:hypothetical protein